MKNEATNPMNTSKEVSNSTDNKTKQDFPGYPHYPANEDMMAKNNIDNKVDLDSEDNSTATGTESVREDEAPTEGDNAVEEDELKIVSGTEADVTQEDLEILRSSDQGLVLGKDEDAVDNNLARTGEDLDIPGDEIDNSNENIGEEDEENNYYSIGGDNHDDLEEDKA